MGVPRGNKQPDHREGMIGTTPRTLADLVLAVRHEGLKPRPGAPMIIINLNANASVYVNEKTNANGNGNGNGNGTGMSGRLYKHAGQPRRTKNPTTVTTVLIIVTIANESVGVEKTVNGRSANVFERINGNANGSENEKNGSGSVPGNVRLSRSEKNASGSRKSGSGSVSEKSDSVSGNMRKSLSVSGKKKKNERMNVSEKNVSGIEGAHVVATDGNESGSNESRVKEGAMRLRSPCLCRMEDIRVNEGGKRGTGTRIISRMKTQTHRKLRG